MTQNIEYYEMPSENMFKVIHFVVDENYLHHQEVLKPADINSVIHSLCDEEKQYKNSHIFIAMSQNIICGSIRIFQKTTGQILPIEKMFNINVELSAGEGTPIFHIGRFAVSKGVDKNGSRVFKTLMALVCKLPRKQYGLKV